jgi:hypothetical protein
MKSHMTKGAVVMGLGVILLIQLETAANSFAAQKPMSTKELNYLIAHATTAQDHERLATYYRQKAERANATVAEHKQMLAAYCQNPFSSYAAHRSALKTGSTPDVYCDNLIRIYSQEAKEYTALAQYHENMAAQASKVTNQKPAQ